MRGRPPLWGGERRRPTRMTPRDDAWCAAYETPRAGKALLGCLPGSAFGLAWMRGHDNPLHSRCALSGTESYLDEHNEAPAGSVSRSPEIASLRSMTCPSPLRIGVAGNT